MTDQAADTHPLARLMRPLQIGSLSIANRLILAPMAGVTDRPFRMLCRQLGAGLAISEMVSSNPALRDTRKSRERTDHAGEPGPIAVQIAGADPLQMAEAARYNVDCGAQIIDINLGCPAKKVCRLEAGSALLRDEALVGRILHAVVGAVEVPVTLKTRTGWSPETRNLSRIAAIAADSGISMLTVHGRTRACGYQGEAEHESLAGIRETTKLPLVANGDIGSAEKAFQVLNRTGADAIMIGRAALGRPWIFDSIATAARRLGAAAGSSTTCGQVNSDAFEAPAPSPARIGAILIDHLQRLYDFYGESRGVRIARKHIGWYTRDLPHDAEVELLRKRLMTTTTAFEQLALLRVHFQTLGETAADRELAA